MLFVHACCFIFLHLGSSLPLFSSENLTMALITSTIPVLINTISAQNEDGPYNSQC